MIEERADSRAFAADRRRLFTMASILGPAAFLGLAGWAYRWTADDAFIHFRVVDQLLHGNGPVFNAGERVEASTSVAWVMLLATARVATLGQVRIEYLALWLALTASVGAVVLASVAAMRLQRRATTDRNDKYVVPLGALVVVVVRAYWDFATSGLEMGLVLLWLAACFYLLVACSGDHGPRSARRGVVAVLLGIGPLIRPDLLVFSVAFIAALVALERDRGRAALVRLVCAAAALPVAYQIFRMGYYAQIVPNTAVTKSAGSSQWSRGWHYAADLLSTYRLVIPLGVVTVLIVQLTRALRRHVDGLIVVVAVLAGTAMHAVYVVRVGGDFMHARLLLPALFAFVMPVAVVFLRTRVVLAALCIVALWAVACAATCRFDVTAKRLDWIDDERYVYQSGSGVRNPVTLDDYRRALWVQPGFEARLLARQRRGILLVPAAKWGYTEKKRSLPLASLPDGLRRYDDSVVVASVRVGAVSFAAGTDVYVVDRFGLADAVTSHFEVNNAYKPGHDKYAYLPWIEGRFADPRALEVLPPMEHYGADLSRATLACGAPARFVRDISARLTPGQFLDNVKDSFGNTVFSLSPDPSVAAAQACGR